MSSLRISQHNRAIGATAAGGDSAIRPEKADDEGVFAAALGAAGVAPKDASILFGGSSGNESGGTGPSRKRSDDAPKSDAGQAAASLVPDAGNLVPAPAQNATAGNGGGDNLSGVARGKPGASNSMQIASLAGGTTATVAAATQADPLSSTADPGNLADMGSAATDDTAKVVMLAPGPIVPPPSLLAATAPAAPIAGAQTPGADPATTGGTALNAAISPSLGPVLAAHQFASASSASTSPTAGAATSTDPAAAATIGAPALVLAPQAVPGQSAGLAQTLPQAVTATAAAGQGAFDAPFGGDGQTRDRPVPAAAPVDGSAGILALNGAAGASPSGAPTPGSSAATDQSLAGSVPDQVSGHLARMLSSGTRDMVMQLHPPELGDLTVRVAVNGRDVSAWFASPQPQVQAAIAAAMGQLQSHLGDAGYNLAGAWVGADASGGQQQGAASPPPASTAFAPAAVASPASFASRPATSGLNIYV